MNLNLQEAKPQVFVRQQLRTTVRPVSQVLLRLRTRQPQVSFEAVRRKVLNWMASRTGTGLPDEAWAGRSFELEEIGSQRTAAIALNNPRYWTARLDDADKIVARRTWSTEIGIGELEDGSSVLGVRLLCATQGPQPNFEPSIPGFVRPILETQIAELDGRIILPEPWFIDTREEVDELHALLRRSRRRHNVIVFSLPEGSVDPAEAGSNPYTVSARTAGAAHVVIISGPCTYYLTRLVGKDFSVYRQAVRTYRPKFDPSIDEPFRHPLALPERIVNWLPDGAASFERLLVSQALSQTVAGGDTEALLPSFSYVRRKAAEARLSDAQEAGIPDTELLQLAEDEIISLHDSLDEEKHIAAGLIQTAEQERDEALAQAAQTRSINAHLRNRLESLERQLAKASGADHKTPIPASIDDFELWCRQHLTGKVEVLTRAFAGVKKSAFEDVDLIYRSLLLLRDFYVPMRRSGGQEPRAKFDEECRHLGITEEATFHGERAGEEGDTYFVQYAGRRTELDRHLKRGNSRESRYCFRLYFFWDEDNEQVVVGWLPSHLATRAT